MKSNIERVVEWLSAVGITDVAIRKMKAQCCPFHWSDVYIEVNPKTSIRTLRKHFKRDVLPYFQTRILRELPNLSEEIQRILTGEFISKCPGYTDYKVTRNTLPNRDLVILHVATLGTRSVQVQTIVKEDTMENAKTDVLRVQLGAVYDRFNKCIEEMKA